MGLAVAGVIISAISGQEKEELHIAVHTRWH